MTTKQLERVLIKYDKDCSKNWQTVVNAVNEYIYDEFDATFDSTFSDGEIDRMLDGIILRTVWIKDRMNNNKKLTNKVRKALGYY